MLHGRGTGWSVSSSNARFHVAFILACKQLFPPLTDKEREEHTSYPVYRNVAKARNFRHIVLESTIAAYEREGIAVDMSSDFRERNILVDVDALLSLLEATIQEMHRERTS